MQAIHTVLEPLLVSLRDLQGAQNSCQADITGGLHSAQYTNATAIRLQHVGRGAVCCYLTL